MSYRTIISMTATAVLGIACASTDVLARGGARVSGGAHVGAYMRREVRVGGVRAGGVYHRGYVRPGVAVGVGAAAVGAAAVKPLPTMRHNVDITPIRPAIDLISGWQRGLSTQANV